MKSIYSVTELKIDPNQVIKALEEHKKVTIVKNNKAVLICTKPKE